MQHDALATDYDGTIATDGRLDESTIVGLDRLRAAGRALVLVTGRELGELKRVCHRLDLFDRVVAENGAVMYRPADGTETVLGERPPEGFVAALKARGVGPLSVGRVVVATWQPHEPAVLAVIREMGLDRLRVVLNKRAVMILPEGIDKVTGLASALAELGIPPDRVVGVGDAENDETFLALCGYAVAVANALPALKTRADHVTRAGQGAGVVELIEDLLGGQLPQRTRGYTTVGENQ